jgi:hypothetical protein
MNEFVTVRNYFQCDSRESLHRGLLIMTNEFFLLLNDQHCKLLFLLQEGQLLKAQIKILYCGLSKRLVCVGQLPVMGLILMDQRCRAERCRAAKSKEVREQISFSLLDIEIAARRKPP